MQDEHLTGREFELKFEVDDAQLRRLRSNRVLDKIFVGRASNKKLRSIYFDTADHSLRANGISLRVRQIGKDWVQTLKFDHQFKSGLSRPVEIEQTVPGASPEIARLKMSNLPENLRQLLKKSKLEPVFETVISRTARQLHTKDGSCVEIAFDSGAACVGDNSAPINEVELELKSGVPSAVFHVARTLIDTEAMRFADGTKAERGYRLANGERSKPMSPARHVLPRLKKKDSAEDVFRALLRACHEQISHNWKVLMVSSHPEGPHQFRVGLRRLRSVLDGFEELLDSKTLNSLQKDAGDLARLAGSLRDADVLVEETVVPVANANPDEPQLMALVTALQKERESVRMRVLGDLKDGRTETFLLKLAEILEGEHVFERKKSATLPSAKAVARTALKKSWRRVQQRGLRIAELKIEERHDMRKALKRFRYQFEAFAQLFPEQNPKRLQKKLKPLQESFGYLNDVAMAEQLRHMNYDESQDAAILAGASEFVLGWHAARAEQSWQNARTLWTSIDRAKRKWNAGD